MLNEWSHDEPTIPGLYIHYFKPDAKNFSFKTCIVALETHPNGSKRWWTVADNTTEEDEYETKDGDYRYLEDIHRDTKQQVKSGSHVWWKGPFHWPTN